MTCVTGLTYLVLAVLAATIHAIPTVSAVGSKFFTSDGNQFYIKGIAYQLTSDDPLVDTQQCQLDAALMKQLGANTIRVYHVDASQDHAGCMSAFADQGIYLFVDLDSFQTYISYNSTPSWTQDKSDAYRAVMDEFQQYENTAGFFVGNEVLNTLVDSAAAPYLLAAAVDLKAYRQSKNYRDIAIGYSATDTNALPMLQDYLVCRPNVSERLEFYSLNSYRWCGAQATYTTSQYSMLEAAAANYPVPIFFSETGCNTVPPRDFNDQSAILGPDMDGTWSGAIIYEWIEETNNYGLIQYGPPVDSSINDGTSVVQGFTRQGTPTPVLPDFTNLKSQWATLTPTGVQQNAYSPTTTAPSCPASSVSGWTVNPSAPLPTLGDVGTAAAAASTVNASAQPSGSSASKTSKAAGARSARPTTGLGCELGIAGASSALAVVVAVLMLML